MAVITQFVVVREGVEKMTFTTKKEADAYDKMLDIADSLVPFLEKSEVEIEEKQLEDMAYYLASNKDDLLSLLKGGVTNKSPAKKAEKKQAA
ncbi:YebG family protein [Parashewanella tropica]|uniref:YebG family protein n=1 Tax=Parashewanella tropica TaxID=2547970 RepID=UPI00105A9DB8|nr:YebG family protein [Parashewanella tropica]